MTDPTRYVRKALTDALKLNDFVLYGQNPPSSAVAPYGILTVNTAGISAKNCEMYRTTTTIEIYSEWREYGGRKSIDEISDNIISLMVPNSYSYLVIDGFTHANVKLVSSDERVSVVDSVTTYIKTMRFEHLISKN